MMTAEPPCGTSWRLQHPSGGWGSCSTRGEKGLCPEISRPLPIAELAGDGSVSLCRPGLEVEPGHMRRFLIREENRIYF